jgi:hypothetical protein
MAAAILVLAGITGAGCAKQIDHLITPLHQKLEEVGDMAEHLDLPVDLDPETKVRVKSRKLMIEKKF